MAALLLGLAAPTVAGAQIQGFEGVWARYGADCDRVAGDGVPIVITGREIRFYETLCRIDSVTPIGDAGQSWRLESSCSGEGEDWQTAFLLARFDAPPGDGTHAWLTMVNLTWGMVDLLKYCRAVP